MFSDLLKFIVLIWKKIEKRQEAQQKTLVSAVSASKSAEKIKLSIELNCEARGVKVEGFNMNNLSAHQLPPPPPSASLTQQFCLRWHNHQVSTCFIYFFFLLLSLRAVPFCVTFLWINFSMNRFPRRSIRLKWITFDLPLITLWEIRTGFSLPHFIYTFSCVTRCMGSNTNSIIQLLTEHENQRDNLLFCFSRLYLDSIALRVLAFGYVSFSFILVFPHSIRLARIEFEEYALKKRHRVYRYRSVPASPNRKSMVNPNANTDTDRERAHTHRS